MRFNNEFPNDKYDYFIKTAPSSYLAFDLTEDSKYEKARGIFTSSEKIFNVYCPECKENRTFSFDSSKTNTVNNDLFIGTQAYGIPVVRERIIDHAFICDRNNNHTIYIQSLYGFIEGKRCVLKIGQYPSNADLDLINNEDKLKEYKKQIPEGYKNDYLTAIRCNANGINVAAFTYLRRIFEALILEAYELAIESGKTTLVKEEFLKQKMQNKIESIKECLPSDLNHSNYYPVYGALSSGLHYKSEEWCKENFTLMRDAIDLILDEKVRKKKEREQKAKINNDIKNIKK